MINDIQRALNRRLDEMSSISSRWVSTWLKLDEVQCTAIIDWIGLKESTWNRFGCINMAVQLVKYTKGNATSRFVGWMASAALLLARRWSKINDGYVFRLSNSLSLSLSLSLSVCWYQRSKIHPLGLITRIRWPFVRFPSSSGSISGNQLAELNFMNLLAARPSILTRIVTRGGVGCVCDFDIEVIRLQTLQLVKIPCFKISHFGVPFAHKIVMKSYEIKKKKVILTPSPFDCGCFNWWNYTSLKSAIFGVPFAPKSSWNHMKIFSKKSYFDTQSIRLSLLQLVKLHQFEISDFLAAIDEIDCVSVWIIFD